MKKLTFVLLLSLTLSAVPATATTVFNNFPINGQIQGWPIISGIVSASDSFIVPEDATINRVNFGALVTGGAGAVTSVDWVIGLVSNGTLGRVVAAGTGLTSGGVIANYGYDVESLSFAIPNLRLDDGTLYYLTLANAVSENGGIVAWDQNDGPNSTLAWYTALDTTVPISDGAGGCITSPFSGDSGSGTCSESFQLLNTPEPSTMALLGSGVFVAFALRRKAVGRALRRP